MTTRSARWGGFATGMPRLPRLNWSASPAAWHDVFNDQTHRTVAAVVVLFLERIRQDSGPGPIAVPERLGR